LIQSDESVIDYYQHSITITFAIFFMDFHYLLSAIYCYWVISIIINTLIDCHWLILVYQLTTPGNRAQNWNWDSLQINTVLKLHSGTPKYGYGFISTGITKGNRNVMHIHIGVHCNMQFITSTCKGPDTLDWQNLFRPSKIPNKICLCQFSICQGRAHWETAKYFLTTSFNHTETNTIAYSLFAGKVTWDLRSHGLTVIFNHFDRICCLGILLLVF